MFIDREDAGRQLADRLADQAPRHPILVALPRGGVVVAAVIAERLRAPLDVIVVRKLGCPWQPELGVGALAEGDVRIINEDLVRDIGLRAEQLAEVVEREAVELARRADTYRGDRPPLPVDGRTAIVVDDGLATGYTARASIEALRRRGAARVTLAVPVGPGDALTALRDVADEVVVLTTADWFFAIGDFYDDFAQTTDDEVVALLSENRARSS